MSNVLFVYERNMATVSSMMGCFESLFQRTEIYYKFMSCLDVVSHDIERSDVVVLIRPHNYLSQKIAEQAKKCGCFIVFFMDDDLFNLPKSMPSMPWRRRSLERNLKISNVILSSSQYIVNKYKERTEDNRGTVAHTVISQEELRMIPRWDTVCHDPIKLVFAAGGNHEGLFYEFVEPMLTELDRKYGEMLSLTFVGTHPEIDKTQYSMEITYQRSMPLLEYRDYMRKQKFDIGFAPLNDDSFSKCKYFNKFIEYTMAGVVGIYSNCEPYTFVIKDGFNGKLAENTPQSWLECVCELMDGNIRKKNLDNAMDQLKNEFNVEKIKKDLLNGIPEFLICRPKQECGSLLLFKIVYELFRVADIIYLSWFYFRRGGVLGLWRRIRIHFQESKVFS